MGTEVKKYIKGKVVFLGMGNPMRGDDGAGCEFIEELRRSGKVKSSKISLFNGGQVPENYVEPIVKIRPDKVFIVETVDFGASPGEIRVFEEAELQSNFSTHTLSLSFILEYLKEKTRAKVFILGIQPRQLGWGSHLSPEVKKAVEKLIRQLK